MNPIPKKVFVNDNAFYKFSQQLIDHWRKRGHEVYCEPGANPAWAKWADLIYIDFLDGNFYTYLNGEGGDRSHPPYEKNRIAVRMIDIDYFQFRHTDPLVWTYLDDMIVISKFIYDRVVKETTPYSDRKLHLIKPGVDLTTFTFKENRERGYKIGCVTGNLWEAKGGFEAIRIFQELNRLYPNKPWELHIRGQMIPPEWHQLAYDRLFEVSGLKDKIFLIPQISQPELLAWYHRMDYILITSHKEAFSYASAEGMATGLKPVINNFFGSDDIWPAKYRFSSINEACLMLGEGDYNPQKYRQYIIDNYDAERMFKQYDDLFGT